jgi:hypothetical protein
VPNSDIEWLTGGVIQILVSTTQFLSGGPKPGTDAENYGTASIMLDLRTPFYGAKLRTEVVPLDWCMSFSPP